MFNFLVLGDSLICYMSASLFSPPSSWNSTCQHISAPIWPTISFSIVTCLKEEGWEGREKKYVCFTVLEFYIPRRPFNANSTPFLKKACCRNEEPETKGNKLTTLLAHRIILGSFPYLHPPSKKCPSPCKVKYDISLLPWVWHSVCSILKCVLT